MKKRRQAKGKRRRNPPFNFRAYSRTAKLNPPRKGKSGKIPKAQLRTGIRIEMEHTKRLPKSRRHAAAKRIAIDHLREFPNYYTRHRKCFPEEYRKKPMLKIGRKVLRNSPAKVTLVDPNGIRSFGINRRSLRNPSKGKEVKATYMSKGYAHKVFIPNWKRVIDPRSIRTRVIRKKDGGKRLLRFGCPKGQWMPIKKRCKVGTKAISILTPKEEKILRIPTAREITLFAVGNPRRRNPMGGKAGMLFPLAGRGHMRRGTASNPFRGTKQELTRLIGFADKMERCAKRKHRMLWSESDLTRKERAERDRLLKKVVIPDTRKRRGGGTALPFTGEEFLRIATARGYKNPEGSREMEYKPGMRVRNLQALPRGLGAKYLIVIPAPESDPGAWIAKAWAREKPMLTGIEHVLVMKRA